MSLKEIKETLIDLYLGIKIRKTNDIENINDNYMKEEKNNLNKLSIMDIINYISNSIEILSELKAQEKYEQKVLEDEKREKYYNYENEEDANGLKLYEGMLIKAESDIRNHIRVRLIYIKFVKFQIEQELKIHVEDLNNDLELIINKYNNLVKNYNLLKNKKNETSRNIKNDLNNNNSNNLSKNKNNKNEKDSKVCPGNNSIGKNSNKVKINKQNLLNKKNISIIENSNNINCFDNDYISHLRKENEKLKRIIIKYECSRGKSINYNNSRKSVNILKERSNLFKNKMSDRKKRPTSNNNSKEHSYFANYFSNKIKPNRNIINDKSLFMNQTNYSVKKKLNDSIINENHYSIKKVKKLSNLNNDNQAYNTISSLNNEYLNDNNHNNSSIKKNRTCFHSINKNGKNRRMMNKLKVKCKDFLLNNKTNTKTNISKEKNKSKFTPKNIIKNKVSFFSHSNNNLYKIKNRLKSLKILDLELNSININKDSKNNTASDYFFKNHNKNNNQNKSNRLNTDFNVKNKKLIHRNTDIKMTNKLRLIKEFKTEKDNLDKKEKSKNILNIEYYSKNNKIIINKKNLLSKKSKNNLVSSININKNIKNNNEENDKMKCNQIINSNLKNKYRLDNNLNGCLSSININKKDKNEKILFLNHIKRKTPFIENSFIKNNPTKNNNTISNISNFNNCNYIYLLNNGEKYIKTNKQLKI